MDDATETEAEEDTASRCGGITEYDREMAGNQGCVVHETVVIMFLKFRFSHKVLFRE